MKNKELRTVLIMFGANVVYYIAYFIFVHTLMAQVDPSKTSMVYWAFAFLCVECWVPLIGYFFLFLKLRIGQILLAVFYIIKLYTYIATLISDGWMEIRFIAEMIFYFVLLVAIIFSPNVNRYIKMKWNEKETK